MGFADANEQIFVLCMCTSLASVRSKFRGQNSNQCAGVAVVAMRAVHKGPTAAKSLAHQIAVDLGVDLLAWPRNLRAGDAAIKVAAGVCRRGVVLNLCQWNTGAMCHALAVCDAASSFQYTGSNTHAGAGRSVRLVTLLMNAVREISRAPNDARWRVFCWQSMRGI